MVIRPVEDGDFPAIAELTNLYIRSTPIHFAHREQSPDEFREAWIASRHRYPFLVGVEDDPRANPAPPAPAEPIPFRGLCAYAKCSRWRDREAYAWTAETGIYVHPARQGRGVGTRLYRALIDAARDRGFHTLVAGLTLPNPASERLHEGVGFTRCAHFRAVGWKFERWHDVGFYEFALRGPEHRPQPM